MAWFKVAEMAVKYRKEGICGMGVYGDEDLSEEGYNHYVEIFDYLKRYHIKLAIFAGKTR